jgi:5-methylthioadenosine/S-adenosylhomocysteine deaminase
VTAPAVLLVVDGDVVTMRPDRAVLERTTVAVAGGRVLALGAAEDLRAAHPGAAELDARGCVVVPGLVNAHQHTTGDPLVRSAIPDTLDAQQAIFDWAMPIHQAHEPLDDELSATLTAVESLLRGVTTIAEPGTVAHPLSVAAGLRSAGIRARIGTWGWDAPGLPWSAPVPAVVDRQAAVLEQLPPDGLVAGWVTLVGHDLVSDELFVAATELARATGSGMTFHMSPGEADVHAYGRRSGLRPLVHLAKLGVLGEHLVLGHAVWLDDEELAAVLESRTAVACCPGAYLRLGQGYGAVSRHAELLHAGGRLALGCDSHNAGDAPDLLRSAWLLAALSRDQQGGVPVTAAEAFAAATRGGADALGLGDEVGSIEPGRAADLVVLDTSDPAWNPRGDLALQLVWGTPSHTVRDVLVDGTVVVRDGQVTTVDVPALHREVADRSRSLLRRAGIDVPSSWPVHAAPRPPIRPALDRARSTGEPS